MQYQNSRRSREPVYIYLFEMSTEIFRFPFTTFATPRLELTLFKRDSGFHFGILKWFHVKASSVIE